MSHGPQALAPGVGPRAALLGGLAVLLCACRAPVALPPRPPAAGYLKGQTHLHSSASADSRTPPEAVSDFYAARGYDFIVFTDHDLVTRLPPRPPLLRISGVELTQNLARCEPPPEPGQDCLLHVNALFVSVPGTIVRWATPRDWSRRALYERAFEQVDALGGLAQLNHPNFGWAADAALITALARRRVLLLEIANQSGDVANEGDWRHPDTEALWDAALTAGATVYGVASDDAHHYGDADGLRAARAPVYPGDRGFVMVHAPRDPAALRAAMARGDFYSSTGVLLAELAVTPEAVTLQVAAEAGRTYRIECITAGGRIAATAPGPRMRCPRGPGYVRARVVDDQGRRAWPQPVRG